MKAIIAGITVAILIAIGSAIILEGVQVPTGERYTAAGSVRL